jgi:hypothetical protein
MTNSVCAPVKGKVQSIFIVAVVVVESVLAGGEGGLGLEFDLPQRLL